jgi:Na+-driven multidrug efflux pump
VNRPLALRDVAAFFLPLALTSNLMMVSHSIIHAAMARWENPTVSLAAFSAVFTFHTILSSPTVVAPYTMLAFLRDRGTLAPLVRFHGLVMLAPMLVMAAVAATPAGNWIFGALLGASPAVAAQARAAAWVFAMLHPIIAMRSMATSLFMLNRRTLAITLGTTVRMAALAALLFGLGRRMGGALGAASSLVGSIVIETLFMTFLARRSLRELPPAGPAATTHREMWGFAWPLMISQITEGSLAFVINVFIGRLARPDLALAAFGVVRGLAMLLLSPLRNLAQTAQALARTGPEQRVLLRFTGIAVGATALLIAILFWTGLRAAILDGVMGLQADLSRYCAPGVQAMLWVPLFWGYGALFRGLLSARRQTRVIGFSSAFKMAAVIAAGSSTLLLPDANGTVVGIAALAAAFAAESGLLGWHCLRSGAEAAAPSEAAPAGTRPGAGP